MEGFQMTKGMGNYYHLILHGGLSKWDTDGWIRHVGIWNGEMEKQIQVQNVAAVAKIKQEEKVTLSLIHFFHF